MPFIVDLPPNQSNVATTRLPLHGGVVAVQATLLGSSCLMLGTGIGLEGYLMPKEFLLHLSVAIATWLVWVRRTEISLTKTDLLLLLVLGTSALSAMLVSINAWWALREMALTISAAMLFWISRALAVDGKERLLRTAGWAMVLAALIGILEAKGILPALSVAGRNPGGAFGNRNFLAHGMVLGMPLLVRMILLAPLRRQAFGWGLALMLSVSMVVISRSRGAWLTGGILSFGAIFVGLLHYRQLNNLWSRVSIVCLSLVLGVVITISGIVAKPWKTETAYRDTAGRILDHTAGSGRGRVIQYANTLKMIVAHPLLGVGPGHWSVYYPEVAEPGDPSWRPDAGQPVNRFPNSDSLALASERGIPTAILLICAALSLGIWALRRIREKSQLLDSADGWLILFTLGAAFLLGITDSVLLRPEPLIFLAVILGVTSGNQPIWKRWQMHSLARPFGLAVIGMSLVFASYLGVRCYASFLKLDHTLEATRKAWALDRGDYVIGTNLAKRLYRMNDYEGAISVLSNVLRLYPHSRAAHKILLASQRRQLEESLDR